MSEPIDQKIAEAVWNAPTATVWLSPPVDSDYTQTHPLALWPLCPCGHVLWHEQEQMAGACWDCLKATAMHQEEH